MQLSIVRSLTIAVLSALASFETPANLPVPIDPVPWWTSKTFFAQAYWCTGLALSTEFADVLAIV